MVHMAFLSQNPEAWVCRPPDSEPTTHGGILQGFFWGIGSLLLGREGRTQQFLENARGRPDGPKSKGYIQPNPPPAPRKRQTREQPNFPQAMVDGQILHQLEANPSIHRVSSIAGFCPSTGPIWCVLFFWGTPPPEKKT